jgi:hypothetical protein
MIVFRHADPRVPFLWETSTQPAARWHGDGEGPVQYLAETPDGAWAEFLRHEEIRDPEDLATISRSLWAIDLPRAPVAEPSLPLELLTGGTDTYDACRREARRVRARGVRALVAPSAAVLPDTPSGYRTEGGLRPGPTRSESAFVLFGSRPDLVGWVACSVGRPSPATLERVRHLSD